MELSVRRILVPTDFSEPAGEALEVAIAFARKFGARLTLMNAQELPTYAFPDAIMPVTPEIIGELERTARAELERLAEHARSSGVHADVRAVVGPHDGEILRAAEELEADLVIMGTHGRTGLRHVILGSVAERVVRRAPCPVLTVRPHATERHLHT
jgi:nucleotide-binding universal stress UspA family protein